MLYNCTLNSYATQNMDEYIIGAVCLQITSKMHSFLAAALTANLFCDLNVVKLQLI